MSMDNPHEENKTRRPYMTWALLMFSACIILTETPLKPLSGIAVLLFVVFAIMGLVDKYITHRGWPVKKDRRLTISAKILGIGATLVILIQLFIPAIYSARRAAEEREIDTRRTVASQQASSYAIQTNQQESASQRNPQVVSGNTFEDFDYAFSIQRPSAKWQILAEKNASQIVPDSVMGMMTPEAGGLFVVITEEIEGSLDAYVKLMELNYGEDAKSSLKSLTINGQPAVKMTFTNLISGMEFGYVNYILKKNNFAFQLFGWSEVSKFAGVKRDLEAIAKSFLFSDVRQPQVRNRTRVANDYGFDWIIKDNVYSNASFGFRIAPDNDLRLMRREELTQVHNAADAGLVSSSPSTYHIYLIEKTNEEVARQLFRDWEQEMGVNLSDSIETTTEVADQNARQRIYHNIEVEGNLFDYAWTYFFRDGVLYRLLSWWMSSDRDAAIALLQNSMKQFSWIDASQQHALQQELATLDANNAVGTDHSIRNGVFRDFAVGYNYTLPPGLWKANTGDKAIAENPACRLDINKYDEGIVVQLIPERGLEMSAEEYHRALLANLGAAEDTTIEEKNSGTLGLKLSSFQKNDGITVAYRLASAVRGDRYIQLITWALKENESQLDDHLAEIISGLDIPEESPQAEQRTLTTLEDNRLGYKLSFKPDWKVKLQQHPVYGPIGSLIAVSHPDGAIIGQGICAPMTDFTEDMMIDGMLRSSAVKLDPTTRKDSKSTLAGLPARCVRFKGMVDGQSAQAVIWLARRGNTVYLLLALGKENLDMEDYKKYFSLID